MFYISHGTLNKYNDDVKIKGVKYIYLYWSFKCIFVENKWAVTVENNGHKIQVLSKDKTRKDDEITHLQMV